MILGSLVALATPMTPDGSVDQAALKQLVEWHVEQGTHGIVAVGTTGESATLDVDEHLGVVRTVIEVAAGRLAVIAGTGANSTREAIELTAAAASLGADAALTIAAAGVGKDDPGVRRHAAPFPRTRILVGVSIACLG